jgi:hypothetical protein
MNGDKTLDLVMKELGIGKPKVHQSIAALGITPTTFNIDKRSKYYSQEDVERTREWLRNH